MRNLCGKNVTKLPINYAENGKNVCFSSEKKLTGLANFKGFVLIVFLVSK